MYVLKCCFVFGNQDGVWNVFLVHVLDLFVCWTSSADQMIRKITSGFQKLIYLSRNSSRYGQKFGMLHVLGDVSDHSPGKKNTTWVLCGLINLQCFLKNIWTFEHFHKLSSNLPFEATKSHLRLLFKNGKFMGSLPRFSWTRPSSGCHVKQRGRWPCCVPVGRRGLNLSGMKRWVFCFLLVTFW